MSCHAAVDDANQAYYLTCSWYTETGPTSSSTDPKVARHWIGESQDCQQMYVYNANKCMYAESKMYVCGGKTKPEMLACIPLFVNQFLSRPVCVCSYHDIQKLSSTFNDLDFSSRSWWREVASTSVVVHYARDIAPKKV